MSLLLRCMTNVLCAAAVSAAVNHSASAVIKEQLTGDVEHVLKTPPQPSATIARRDSYKHFSYVNYPFQLARVIEVQSLRRSSYHAT